MSDDPRLELLLDELFESQSTPEQVCASCPELLADVRRRWQEIKQVRDELDVLFPPSTGVHQHRLTHPFEEMPLPTLPGYEVQEVLGRGGVGVVYRAVHVRLNRPVAVKMLLSGHHASPDELKRFMREAEAVAGLHHPNVVALYDVGEVDGRPYFTMEFIEGGNLARKLAEGPMPAREAAVLVAQVAEAIEGAHQRGIIHRDVKPGNVLLNLDGTPKVSDFGLARLEGEAGLTLSGAPVGTPSYMAPEQARGDKHAIGPATDVYALGAILYECLTGRPPFRAETPSATVQQVLVDEPVPPERLNRRVPRDLDTICLKCLEKDPRRRYLSAAALAGDLHLFQRGEPITARKLGWPGRMVRLARRHPTIATLFVTLPLATLLAVALFGVWWLEARQRVANAVAAGNDLRAAVQLAEASAWDRAQAVLNRVEGRLAQSDNPDLHRLADQLAADLHLGERLEKIRLMRAPLVGADLIAATVEQEYEAAFRDARLADGQPDPDEVAARIRASTVRQSIVAALDDWAVCSRNLARQRWCLQVAQRADTETDGWRRRVRDSKVWQDKSALAGLAATVPVKEQSLPLLLALGLRLEQMGGNATALFQRILAVHPNDFAANLHLGNALLRRDPKEAIGYFRAALAIRPSAVVTANNLAAALRADGRLDEAVACYERAIHIDPTYAPAYNNLGLALRDQGKLDEAQASFERAIEIHRSFVHAHMNLGNLLRRKGQVEAAIECYQEASRLNPGLAAADYSRGLIAAEQGHVEDAIKHYQKAIQVDPRIFQAHSNLGRLLVNEGRLDEGIHHLQAAVAIKPDDHVSHRSLGRALKEKELPSEALVHLFQAHYLKKEYVAAAKLCADTFSAHPNLAGDFQAEHRYGAARAAALAGTGQGNDAAEQTDAERERLRAQAHKWLQLELAEWKKRVDMGIAADRIQATKALSQWQKDPDLAGLREPDALKQRSADERNEWNALWSEVDTLLNRAQVAM